MVLCEKCPVSLPNSFANAPQYEGVVLLPKVATVLWKNTTNRASWITPVT
jgi:hypothetical protein